MKVKSLWYYSFKPMLEYELLVKRISTRNHFNLPPMEVASFIALSSSDNFDYSTILCLLGRDNLHWQPVFWKALLRHGLYRINVEPDGEEITLSAFIEGYVFDNDDYYQKWYRKITEAGPEVGDSIYLTQNPIQAYRWVNVERYNGESWSKVDLKKLDFIKPVEN